MNPIFSSKLLSMARRMSSVEQRYALLSVNLIDVSNHPMLYGSLIGLECTDNFTWTSLMTPFCLVFLYFLSKLSYGCVYLICCDTCLLLPSVHNLGLIFALP